MTTRPNTPTNDSTDVASLPAVRRARAEAVLRLMDRDGSDVFCLGSLSRRLVPQYRGDIGCYTPAQLERAIDDLAEAGAISVSPGPLGGTLQVKRLRGSGTS